MSEMMLPRSSKKLRNKLSLSGKLLLMSTHHLSWSFLLTLSLPPLGARDGPKSKLSSEGREGRGHHKKQRKEISMSRRDKVPEGMVTEFNSADLNTQKRNPSAVLSIITDLGTTLLEKEAERQRQPEGNRLAIFADWLESELSDDCPTFNTWDSTSAEINKLNKDWEDALAELNQLKTSQSSMEESFRKLRVDAERLTQEAEKA